MERKQLSVALSSALLMGLPFISTMTHAAVPQDLSKQQINVLQAFIHSPTAAAVKGISVKEISRSSDFNKTLHVRIKETYEGYDVWGGDAIVHIPNGFRTGKAMQNVLQAAQLNKGSMNGIVYQQLTADLGSAPATVQAEKALDRAIKRYQQKVGITLQTKDHEAQLIVYVDNKNKAHWAYKVTFLAPATTADRVPARPVYILDANSFVTYEEWNDIHTVQNVSDDVLGGGFGGNKKMGKLVYDGLTDHLPVLNIQRDAATQSCHLRNKDVEVKRCTSSNPWFGCFSTEDFVQTCATTDPEHNNVYWNGEIDAVNEGYSPSNDALFNAVVIKDLYQKWYHIPVLTKPDGVTPLQLTMVVHLNMDNAYWDPKVSTMYFGDGISMFYPLTSLGVAAHEVSHGFTTQHSNLTYSKQSGGMNEAYSDMAAQAAEVFAYGKNSWQIGPEIFKEEGKALRYMDQPSKDCGTKLPGNRCSIDKASQYTDSLNVHYSSGVYNHFFYLLANTAGWDTKKAFDVMVQANSHYWTPSSTFEQGACGVIKAARDYNYDVEAVKAAFAQVEVSTAACA